MGAPFVVLFLGADRAWTLNPSSSGGPGALGAAAVLVVVVPGWATSRDGRRAWRAPGQSDSCDAKTDTIDPTAATTSAQTK